LIQLAMTDEKKQGTIHSSTDGGVVGKHDDSSPTPLLVAPTTADESNRARLRLIPTACFRIDDVRFKFDSSFVLPEAKTEMLSFADLRKSDPRVKDAPISIFGHADPSYLGNFDLHASTYVSGDEYNKILSGRRAIAIYALLVRDPSFWNTLYTNHLGGDVWGADAIQIILDALGQGQASSSFGGSSQGSSTSANSARAQDIANDSGQRQQLFLQYMTFLCGDLKLDKSADFLARGAGQDLKGDVQGCGRFNPLLLFSTEDEARFKESFANKDEATLRGERDPGNAINRRVVILVFRKGSQVLPSRWPCPTYKDGPDICKQRFFSGDKPGDIRRSTHDSGAEHRFEDKHDTFACRFFQRISDGSPCDNIDPPPPPICKITSLTVATQPANRARTRIGVGEEVDLTIKPGPATWKITSGGGKLSPVSGVHSTVTFLAGDRADTVTITAKGTACTASITFIVLEPSEARRRQRPGTNLKHTKDRPSIGIKTDLYLFPDDVCFYNVEYRELDATAVTTGVYDHAPLRGAGHSPNPDPIGFTMTVVHGLGTKIDSGGDEAFSGDPGTPVPFAPGSISFAIPYVFSVDGGTEKQFDTVHQVHTLESDGVTLTVTKAGAKGTLQVSDATSSF
jgi:outer membrane protein OmpA-like peptidoglycan-associated protein